MCFNTFSTKLLVYATHGSIAYVNFGISEMTLMGWNGAESGDNMF
jgi:hypothetical protein